MDFQNSINKQLTNALLLLLLLRMFPMDQRMIKASETGNIDELYTLIHEDPYILQTIDSIPFINTPLHISSASGNLAFSMEMMNLKPSFATKLNTYGFTPLHLAIKKGQTRLILSLLKLAPHLIRLPGRQGTTPFHMVVKRGEIDLMTEFLLASPNCVQDANVNGQTALHIAVINDRYEELEALVGWLQRLRQKDAESLEIQVLNKRDQEGNTALHMAAFHNRFKAIKLLVKCSTVDQNIHNRNGLTVLDILQNQRQDEINREIQSIVKESGGKRGICLPNLKKVSEILRLPISFTENFFTETARQRNQISEGSRSALLVIAALIIAATYQTALQPPGGVYQESANESDHKKSVGKAVMNEAYFYVLRSANTLAFEGAVAMVFCLLPAGEGYLWRFLWISVPLHILYLISMSVISTDSIWFFSISVGTIIMIVVVYMMVFFMKWKRSKMKKPEARSELILEGLTSLSLAKGGSCQ